VEGSVTALTWFFDALLTATLVGVAVRALAAEDLVTAIALFVAFGLLMTIAWVRLSAPDIALAEAGIGTGLTGGLLLAALARLRRADAARKDGDDA
jgi:energy-converting hydrogenase B subunit D